MAIERLQRRRNPYSSLEWITNDFLQLQRLAYDPVGTGTWKEACSVFPTTAQGELLAVLDMTDPKHPKLRAPELDAKSKAISINREVGFSII